jgi:hypothetical protein
VSKPKLFNFGACDLLDSLMNKAVMNVFDLQCIDLEERPRLYPSYSTSLLSLYTPIGSLGSEALEYFVKDPNLILDNRPFFEEISKFDYIGHWTANAGPNDFLVINFSTEFYTKYFNKECITLVPWIKPIPEHDWFVKKISQDHLLDFDEEENLGLARELTTDFARSIKKIFQDRVILVDTHLTEKYLLGNGIKRAELINYQFIPYYQNNKLTGDAKNIEYGQRLVKVLLRQFKRVHGGDLPVISVNDSLIYRDPNHRWGSNPFHLHKASADFIGLKIMDACMSKIEKNLTKIYIP